MTIVSKFGEILKKRTWISGVRVTADEATKMPELSEMYKDIGAVSDTVDAESEMSETPLIFI